jgi:Cu(I)/Ag(I) efflux system membrane fusion protein
MVMKKIWLLILVPFIAVPAVIYMQYKSSTSQVHKEDDKEILYWVAPMDPNYRRDKPGKSPMGMDLVPIYAGSEEEDAEVVRISPEVVNNLGVRTARVEKGKLSRRIDTVGYVDYDESRISHVHLRAEGWIHNLVADTEGERVEKGRLLFTLYSPMLVNAQEEYLQAVASGNKTLAAASRERLLALGLVDSQIEKARETGKPSQFVASYATQSGVISALNVRQGMYVKPETEIMSLASLDTIWIEAEVFERQASWVSSGQQAEARIPAMPGRVWKGNVDYVYPELDATTRTLRVRLKFKNPDELLKPNMYANVSILNEPAGAIIHIPREALINDGRVPRVILALGNGRFKARQVIPGMEGDGRIEIIGGLDESDVVVISAQFLIDSEASLNASFQRMEPQMGEMETNVHYHPYGKGTVNSVDHEKRIINISHEAIDSLQWPAMTMDFKVADHVDLDSLDIGDRVKFYLGKEPNGDFFISNIVLAVTEGNDHD